VIHKSVAGLAALALLATAIPFSASTAGELKTKQKKQGMSWLPVPAVQKIRPAAAEHTKKRGAVKGRSTAGRQ
jgi:hypothetical protein